MLRLPRLIVRSVVDHNDRSHVATIDRAIDRCTPELFYDRPSGATIDRELGHRMPRVLVRSVTCRMPRLIVRSVAPCNDLSYLQSPAVTIDRTIGRHDCSYGRSPRLIVRSVVTIDRTICGRRAQWLIVHRSLIATTSCTMSYDGSCHRYSPIVRDSATTRRDRSPYSTAAGDRSKHCRSIAINHTIQKSYDSV